MGNFKHSLLAFLFRPLLPSLFEPVFKILIVYKSGAIQEFECLHFTIKKNEMTWAAIGMPLPLVIGIDEIAAVWQVRRRWRIKQESKELRK